MYYSRRAPVDLRDFKSEDRYKFLMGTVIPRPIALVTSLNEESITFHHCVYSRRALGRPESRDQGQFRQLRRRRLRAD
jgi:hypothetical protein